MAVFCSCAAGVPVPRCYANLESGAEVVSFGEYVRFLGLDMHPDELRDDGFVSVFVDAEQVSVVGYLDLSGTIVVAPSGKSSGYLIASKSVDSRASLTFFDSSHG